MTLDEWVLKNAQEFEDQIRVHAKYVMCELCDETKEEMIRLVMISFRQEIETRYKKKRR